MDPRDAQQLSERVEQLLDEIEESALPPVQARVEELVRSLVALYGAGLERMVATVEATGVDGMRALVDDELVASLLVLHDLHPDDVPTRVHRALDEVRPYLGSHAGGVELLGVDEEGVVHLRLEGSCDGCPSSAVTVASAIEAAVLGAGPDVVGVDVEGMVEEGGVEQGGVEQEAVPPLLQIPPFRPHADAPEVGGPPDPPLLAQRRGARRDWVDVDAAVAPGTSASVETAGGPILMVNLAGDPVAYAERCPDCGAALAGGTLAGEALTCPGCAHRWDLRHAGRGLDSAGILAPVPLLPEGSGWKASLPVGAGA